MRINQVRTVMMAFLVVSMTISFPAFAKKKKLQDTYHFKIDKEKIERSSEKGVITTKWAELSSVDFFPKNVFFNLPNGSMLVPNSYLSSAELEVLKSYAART